MISLLLLSDPPQHYFRWIYSNDVLDQVTNRLIRVEVAWIFNQSILWTHCLSFKCKEDLHM
jgi:hypothetical protein